MEIKISTETILEKISIAGQCLEKSKERISEGNFESGASQLRVAEHFVAIAAVMASFVGLEEELNAEEADEHQNED